nr:RNA-directed DNA polymerase, eukaryota [Tanacetum cinerariifolium]
AYDSIRWDYLLDVLHAFGFGPNWCKWIHGTFTSAMASILVNGSPTAEFPFFRGLKQGDPLAPFLFILVMESLHLSVSRVVSEGVFKGIQLHGSMSICHLFYADDDVFIGEWSDANLVSLVRILNCFYLTPGLKINLQKSQVLGVGVSPNVTNHDASLIGCGVKRTPFRYLGVSVDVQMLRNSAWANTIQKLYSRLSRWKVKTLSVGGRLTLLKSVLGASPLYNLSIYKAPKGVLHDMESIRITFFNGADLSERKITWVAWEKVLASKKNEDKEDSVASKLGSSSVDSSFRRPVRDGIERQQWSDLSSLLESVILSPSKDRWFCDLNREGAFRVKDVRSIIDDIFLPSSEVATRWAKYMPIKINIFMWRARLDRSAGGGILISKTFRPFLIGMVGAEVALLAEAHLAL